MDTLKVGMTHTEVWEITEERTTQRGEYKVFATWSMTRLVESAASGLVAAHLKPGQGQVGVSITVRHMGPAVSCDAAMGMMPSRLIRPTVGLKPTMPFADAGETIEPLVSVPIATTHRFAETATAEPELEPEGLRSSA